MHTQVVSVDGRVNGDASPANKLTGNRHHLLSCPLKKYSLHLQEVPPLMDLPETIRPRKVSAYVKQAKVHELCSVKLSFQ
jgi:hypothetical protein